MKPRRTLLHPSDSSFLRLTIIVASCHFVASLVDPNLPQRPFGKARIFSDRSFHGFCRDCCHFVTTTTRLAMASSSDPFGIFGDENDSSAKSTDKTIRRDPSNGVLVHHAGIEASLWHYVENEMEGFQGETNAKRQRILDLVDHFCYTRHWMMHVGPDKGTVLESFLRDCLDGHLATSSSSAPLMIVELGTYCGYSLIRMSHTLSKRFQEKGVDPNFHIFTVDINPSNVAVAQKMVHLADLSSHVDFTVLQDPVKDEKELSSTVQTRMSQIFPDRQPVIDFLFIDHEKDLYLADLQQLEGCGLIRANTWVAADNIVFFRLNSYRQHMQILQNQGVVKTQLKVGTLEYVQNGESDLDLQDGVGKHGVG